MPALTKDQVHAFEDGGYLAPLRAIPAETATAIQNDLVTLEAREGPSIWTRTKFKPHLLIKSLNDLVRTPAILDAVEGILGPDILVWGVGRFAKPAKDPGFFSYHQDSTYWGLSEPALVTAWVALTPSNPASGCMRVLPGSHKLAQLPHKDTFGDNNMLSRGQEVEVDVDEAKLVDLVLTPGEMSFHHVMAVHGSGANTADHPRVGIGIRYIAGRVAHVEGFKESATLVRGKDHHGHYLLEPQPTRDFEPACVAFYEAIVDESKRRRDTLAARAS